MRGHDLFNFPRFAEAAAELRKEGHTVFSPHEHDLQCGFDPTLGSLEGFDLSQAFIWDVQRIAESDVVALLPGWYYSQGATTEAAIGMLLGKRLWSWQRNSELLTLSHDVAKACLVWYYADGEQNDD